MTFSVLTRRELSFALAASFFLGVFLAAGFLPTSAQLFSATAPAFLSPLARGFGQVAAFPLLAALFFISLPNRHRHGPSVKLSHLYLTIPLPVVIAAVYGAAHHSRVWIWGSDGLDYFWNLLCIPIGEELLFRGWFYNVIDRLFPGRLATATNPLPIAVWASALGFSLWHLQNLIHGSWGLVLFQLLYTLYTGVWLGYLRWRSGGLRLPIVAHFAINAACGLF